MKLTTTIHLCLIMLIAAAASTFAQNSTPEQVVKELYTAHDAGNGPFNGEPARARVDLFFTPRLGDMLWKDMTTKGDEVGAIDGDPLYNAQDTEIMQFKIAKGVVRGTNATVLVTFTNFKKKERLTYSLKKVDKAWKIDDIKYSAADSLSKWLSNAGK